MNQERQELANQEDDVLIESIKSGNTGCFEILIQRYERRVFSFILRMVGHFQDAEELAQDCFVRAYKALPEYQPRGRFCSWLLTIARNLSKNLLAKKYHDGKLIIQEPLPDQVKSKSGVGKDEDPIGEWLAALPEDYRIVMTLKYVADLSCQEIAEMENISESAVKQRLHRGREMIRERMEGKQSSEGGAS